MAFFYMDPFNIDFEPEPSRHVYLIRRPKKGSNNHHHHQHQVQNREQTIPKDHFHVTIDVQQFTPEEISIKTVDRNIIVEAKHEETEDEHGSVYRHFVRKYIISKEFDLENIESRLSTDGVLSITAPPVTNNGPKCKVIPIVQTGKLAKTQTKTEEKKMEVEDGQ